MKTTRTTRRIDAVVPLYVNDASLYPIINDFFESMNLYPDIKLIVIDDCSPLKPLPSWPITFRNEKNLGFTGTVNRGLKLTNAEIILVLNDDLKIKKGDLDRYYLIDTVGIYSPRDTASDNTDRFGAIWGMNRDTYNKMGKLNEKYKHYFSDLDYYNRAKEMYIPITKWQDICVEHRESATYKNEDKKKLFEEDQKKL
jgi:GT2 family glycosyltransferase